LIGAFSGVFLPKGSVRENTFWQAPDAPVVSSKVTHEALLETNAQRTGSGTAHRREGRIIVPLTAEVRPAGKDIKDTDGVTYA
jgi:hypothetical protein